MTVTSISKPDNAGSTTYAYAKESVTITDTAGKWKRYETSGLGELVKVVEPNPAGGANLETTYAYNLRGQLTAAVMTRAGVTQTRSFPYDLATGHLLSVTKPETGTTGRTHPFLFVISRPLWPGRIARISNSRAALP